MQKVWDSGIPVFNSDLRNLIFRTPVNDFLIDDSDEDGEDDDIIAVPFENDSPPSVSFIFILNIDYGQNVYFSVIVSDCSSHTHKWNDFCNFFKKFPRSPIPQRKPVCLAFISDVLFF